MSYRLIVCQGMQNQRYHFPIITKVAIAIKLLRPTLDSRHLLEHCFAVVGFIDPSLLKLKAVVVIIVIAKLVPRIEVVLMLRI